MKKLVALLLLFGIVGCEKESLSESKKIKPLAIVAFEGICSDKEQASPLKEIDNYQVEGEYAVYPDMSFGYIFVTDNEKEKRRKLSWPSHPTQSEEEYFKLISEMNFFERYKYWAREDTPYVKIYKISKEIFQSDVWNVDAYHSYIKGDDAHEDYLHYGYAKASCSLNIKSREGIISDEIANQINWCFDDECEYDYVRYGYEED